jgi:divalent metal cation (Fe/Co/Zn/Cd) transporter
MAGQRRFISLHLLVPGEWNVQKGHDYADRIEGAIVKMFDEPVTVQTHLEPAEDPASMRDIGLDRQ